MTISIKALEKPEVLSSFSQNIGWRSIFFSCLILVTGLLSMDLYNPSLPAIAHDLNASQSLVRNLIVAYLIGLAISQFFYGFASDRYGRKPMVLIALIICTFGNILSVFSHTGEQLFLSRILVGMGAGGTSVISRAILKDAFSNKKALSKAFSIFAMASTISPALAPMIGGIIQQHFLWKANFIFLTIITFLSMLYISVFFNETLLKRESKAGILKGAKYVFSCFDFVCYSVMSALTFSCSLIYYTSSPFIYQNILGISARLNGFMFAIYASGVFIGAYSNRRLLDRYSSENILWGSLSVMNLTSLSMVVLNMLGIFNLFTMVFPTFILAISCGISAPTLISLSILPFNQSIGSASAMQLMIKVLGAAIVLFLFSIIHFRTQLPLSLSFCIISFFVLFLNSVRNIRTRQAKGVYLQ
jgi:MFS transporter, DHA1 family, multidrug resistance protein